MDLVNQAVSKSKSKSDSKDDPKDQNGSEKPYPSFSSGDTILVSVKVREGGKERNQVFKGIVIKIQGSGFNRSFTVRKISEGVGVEKTFPFASPIVSGIQVVAYGKIRRSRLYYLRSLQGRAARVRSELAVMREQREKNKTT